MDIKERFPLLRGPDDVTEGYFELEELERNITLQAYLKHRDAATLWYRGLTLYRRGVLGEWDLSEFAENQVLLAAAGLQSQLLGLGVSTAKSALDDHLAGYYSLAFSAIRHMVETFIIILYIQVKPEKYQLWYENPTDPESKTKTPPARHMVKVLKKSQFMKQISFSRRNVERIFDSWSLMSKGPHPTGEGIVQTRSDRAGTKFVIGATYDEHLCLVGFDHGLYALNSLLGCLAVLRDQDEAWTSARKELGSEIHNWRPEIASRATELLSQTNNQEDSVHREGKGHDCRDQV